MNFEDSAEFYDLLYNDKDYIGECDYVCSLIKPHLGTRNYKIIEFGSGSGIHGRILSSLGHEVNGIEKSQQMIDLGENRINKYGANKNKDFVCVQGDCLNTELGKDYDVAISLFHVLSYQTENDQVLKMFRNAYRQLKKGGLFIFDYWYSPAVQALGPKLRLKEVSNEKFAVTRVANPNVGLENNRIDVNYIIFIEDLKTGNVKKVSEYHKVRSFNLDQIIQFAKQSNFTVIGNEEWVTGKMPCKETWGVCTILKK